MYRSQLETGHSENRSPSGKLFANGGLIFVDLQAHIVLRETPKTGFPTNRLINVVAVIEGGMWKMQHIYEARSQ